jgi:hypothetical protein
MKVRFSQQFENETNEFQQTNFNKRVLNRKRIGRGNFLLFAEPTV